MTDYGSGHTGAAQHNKKGSSRWNWASTEIHYWVFGNNDGGGTGTFEIAIKRKINYYV